jgi:hypothetical protein
MEEVIEGDEDLGVANVEGEAVGVLIAKKKPLPELDTPLPFAPQLRPKRM